MRYATIHERATVILQAIIRNCELLQYDQIITQYIYDNDKIETHVDAD